MGGAISRGLSEDQSGNYNLPADYQTPSFPSLYDPRIEQTLEGEGVFLYAAQDIWSFSVLWMVVFLGLIYLVCSLFAAFTLFLSMSRARIPSLHSSDHTADNEKVQSKPPYPAPVPNGTPVQLNHLRHPHPVKGMTPISPVSPSARSDAPLMSRSSKSKRWRPPFWPIVLIPVIVTALGLMLAIVMGTVVGFALATVYSTGGFLMSTWIPFLWALVMTLILVLGSYSTLTAIL